MSFSLNTNNIIGNKIREEMYLKHLREVERINNREADVLKKQLQYYRSISQLHKNNKQKANRLKYQEINRSIQDKNVKIFAKIQKIGSDEQLKQSAHSLLATMSSVNKNPVNPNSTGDLPEPSTRSSPKNQHTKALHYRYRKKQQELIEQQNAKIFKAIETQKSLLLPLIGKTRSNSDLAKSLNHQSDTTRGRLKVEQKSES